MDKETLSNYGWIVICVMVLAVMLALATPFGSFIAGAIQSTTQGLFDVNQSALNSANIESIQLEWENSFLSTESGQDLYSGYQIQQGDYIYTLMQDGFATLEEARESYKTIITNSFGVTWDEVIAEVGGEEENAWGLVYEMYGIDLSTGGYIAGGFVPSETVTKYWTVAVIDKTKVTYEAMESELLDIPVTNLPSYCFSECVNLTEAPILSSNLTTIGEYAFWKCTSMESITIPDKVTNIGDKAFWKCTSLNSILIPDSVTSIGTNAFADCTNLTTVTFGENSNVTRFEDGIFYCCPSLTSIAIPKSVTYVSPSAFWNCTNLKGITVNSKNSAYHSLNNCLIETVNKIVVLGCEGLTSITIPNGVTSIGLQAFYEYTNLTSVIIPKDVTSVDDWAFYGCTSLSEVYYEGTEEEWNNINFNYGNTVLTSANIHFNSTGK